MKKRFLSILMTLCLSLTLFPEATFAAELDNPESPSAPIENKTPTAETEEPVALADEDAPLSGTCGENLTWTLERNDDGQSSWSPDWTYKLIISGTGNMNDYESYDHESSKDNSAPWHYDNYGNYDNYSKQITEVEIENGVTSIGNAAFDSCWALTSVAISDSVTSIGHDAFSGCNALTSINIPASVICMDGAFESIYYKNNSYLYDGCINLTEINVDPNNRQYFSKDGALYTKEGNILIFCPRGKSSYEIPPGITRIGNRAFCRCGSLTNVTIPDSVTSIGDDAFYLCDALTNVTIPGSVTSIGDGAFQYCCALTNVTIPGSVTSMGGYAFSNCTALTDVTISDGVASLSIGMFSGCTKLKNITIPVSVKVIGENALESCTNFEKVIYTGNETQWWKVKVFAGNLVGGTIIYTGSTTTPDNPNNPNNPDTPDDPNTPTTPGTLDIDMTNGSLGKRLTVEVKSGHWLTIQIRRAGSIAITSLQAPNSNNGTVSVAFSASLGSTVQVWETESEMTFTNGIPNNKILNTVVKSL